MQSPVIVILKIIRIKSELLTYDECSLYHHNVIIVNIHAADSYIPHVVDGVGNP